MENEYKTGLDQSHAHSPLKTNTSYVREPNIDGRHARWDISDQFATEEDGLEVYEVGQLPADGPNIYSEYMRGVAFNSTRASVSRTLQEKKMEFIAVSSPEGTGINNQLSSDESSEALGNADSGGRFGSNGGFSTEVPGENNESGEDDYGLGSNGPAGRDLDADEDPGNIDSSSTPV